MHKALASKGCGARIDVDYTYMQVSIEQPAEAGVQSEKQPKA
jgi:2-methylaconitate cis-trans-isomerase PrpF